VFHPSVIERFARGPAVASLKKRQDKPDHRNQYKNDPQKYKGNNGDSNDYRSESFHHAPIVITSNYL
jgi:hypothetical protein